MATPIRSLEARIAVFQFIEGWYNPGRRHSALGYLDLLLICAAPLTTYRVAKENTDGIPTDRGISCRSSARGFDQRAATQAGGRRFRDRLLDAETLDTAGSAQP